jgi:ferric-dicitrate binding protein FerR (iron transport regulator)
MDIQNNDQSYWEILIVNYLTGSISDEDRARLAEWRCAAEENNTLFRQTKAVWDLAGLYDGDRNFDGRSAGRAFEKRIREARSATRRAALRRYLAYAAVAIPFILLSYFSYLYFATPAATVATAPLVAEVATPKGSKTQVKLPDGSVVWLNAGSTIRYDAGFGATHRALTLTGEAYLEVVRDEQFPLVVEAREVKVTVLGTRFNINAYSDDEQVTVALLQGSVQMDTGHEQIVLTPMDVARYNTLTGQTAVAVNSVGNAAGWINNHLVFNGESFAQIMKILERKFDVDIHVHNSALRHAKFVGDFINDESLEQIFSVMAANRKFKYQIRGKVIEIY